MADMKYQVLTERLVKEHSWTDDMLAELENYCTNLKLVNSDGYIDIAEAGEARRLVELVCDYVPPKPKAG